MLLSVLTVSCGQSANEETAGPDALKSERIVSATVLELLASPADYQDMEVAVSGMVTHVCRHGGQKCFIVADDGETQLRIVPGGDIDEFLVELEGSTVAFKGVFKIQDSQESQDNLEEMESMEEHTVEQAHSAAEKAEFYIEALDFREVTP